jgi:hypothetical protein
LRCGRTLNFVNASLINFADSSEDSRWLKFGIVGLTQAIELFLKARLAAEHQLLVYNNIDNPGRITVSFHRALERLVACGVTLDPEDLRRLKGAHVIRNDIVHFAVYATGEQLRAAFMISSSLPILSTSVSSRKNSTATWMKSSGR